jgi:hypothetical protein
MLLFFVIRVTTALGRSTRRDCGVDGSASEPRLLLGSSRRLPRATWSLDDTTIIKDGIDLLSSTLGRAVRGTL